MKKIRVLLTGGGSGGHIYPLIAVARKLKDQAAQNNLILNLRYFGDAGWYQPLFEGEGIKVRHIASAKLRRYFSILNFLDFFKFVWSIPQALFKIFWFMPDVVFGKGGAGSLVILYVCRFYRIPVIIHESDSIPSLTTRKTEKFSKIVELAFASATKYLENKNAVKVVGNPIREDVVPQTKEETPEARAAAKQTLGFQPQEPLILVLGGSQGSETINNFISENLKDFTSKYQLLHQTGMDNFKNFIGKEIKGRYHPVPFLQRDLKTALIGSDIVISRSGAGAIFEVAASGKPSILIPLENSAANHQAENAFQYEDAGACVVIEEENLFSDLVLKQIEIILNNPENLKKMQESAKNFYKPQAAEIIATDILNLAQ